jgi:hypothetical protein
MASRIKTSGDASAATQAAKRTGRPRRPFVDRFQGLLPDDRPENSCWLWKGRLDRHGYGRIRTGGGQGKSVLAHRASWEIHNSRKIPDGLCVCHSCDQRDCVNPNHLFLGTNHDNIADRDAKQRQIRGVSHHKSRLTPSQVIEIRELFHSGQATKTKLSQMYGVTDTSIHLIIVRRNWRHIP